MRSPRPSTGTAPTGRGGSRSIRAEPPRSHTAANDRQRQATRQPTTDPRRKRERTMRVLITGALGQLGQELLAVFAEDNHHEIVAADVEPVIEAARTNKTVDHLGGVDLVAVDITD